MTLTAAEIEIILLALRDKYGHGYCVNPVEVGRLQAKLSMLADQQKRIDAILKRNH